MKFVPIVIREKKLLRALSNKSLVDVKSPVGVKSLVTLDWSLKSRKPKKLLHVI